MERITKFLKNEIVLVISFVLALVSVICTGVTPEYLHMIDFRTLALLFCLMVVMEGFKRLGVFRALADRFLSKTKSMRGLCLVLCMLCFFSSMLITNDVALITFVPFTLITLNMSGEKQYMIPLIVLETVAANLGSMLTPVGNPQNLFLFSKYQMDTGSFFVAVFPYAVLSFVLIILSVLCLKNGVVSPVTGDKTETIDMKKSAVYLALFVLSLLTVFRIIPYPVTLAICILAVFLCDRWVLLHVDYSLLFTFVFLFIFIGNLGRIPWINDFLQEIIIGREVPVAILASQLFSNVPAAILLSGFTDNAKDLLIGTNLGGLGTLIASMASLISFKFIAKEQGKAGKYLLVFTLVNIAFLACNILLWFIIS